MLSCFSHVWLFETLWTLSPTRLLCPWDSPGKNNGVGFQASLQGSSQPRDWTCVFNISCIGRWVLYHKHHWEAQWLPLRKVNYKISQKVVSNAREKNCTQMWKFINISWHENQAISFFLGKYVYFKKSMISMHVRMFHNQMVEKPLLFFHRCFCQCVPFVDELSTNLTFWWQ